MPPPPPTPRNGSCLLSPSVVTGPDWWPLEGLLASVWGGAFVLFSLVKLTRVNSNQQGVHDISDDAVFQIYCEKAAEKGRAGSSELSGCITV